MRVRNFIKAFKYWNRGHWKSFFFSSLMLTVSTSLVVLFLCLGIGINSALGRIFSSTIARGQIVVNSSTTQVGVMTLRDEDAPLLDRDAAVAISRIPGVEKIDSQLFCSVPAFLTGHVPGLGNNYYTDVTLEGVDSSIIEEPSARRMFNRSFSDTTDRVLPVILSSSLLNLYNAGLAPANQLPGLTPDAVIGLEGLLILGRSSIREESLAPRRYTVKVVGLSSSLSLVALGVPIEFVKEANQYYHPEKTQEYSALFITVESPSEVSRIMEKINAMGFQTKTDNEIVKRTSSFLQLVAFGISILSAIIVISSLVSTIYTISEQISNRSNQIGVLRTLGASPNALTSLFSFQVLVISAVDLLIGYSLGMLLALGLDKFIKLVLPSIYILTGGVVTFHWGLLLVLFLALSVIPTVIAYLIFVKLISKNLLDLLSV
ncbi:MAG: hypothetical protein APR63_02725 [Desulfuromonas sp. SDB]|nr:MAG: hypothetical protein APR63_02725 [Desulfuromonas sp. SDB]